MKSNDLIYKRLFPIIDKYVLFLRTNGFNDDEILTDVVASVNGLVSGKMYGATPFENNHMIVSDTTSKPARDDEVKDEGDKGVDVTMVKMDAPQRGKRRKLRSM